MFVLVLILGDNTRIPNHQCASHPHIQVTCELRQGAQVSAMYLVRNAS